MANTATIERCPNCALLLLPTKDAVELRTARVEELLGQNHPPLDVELSDFRKVAEDTLTALEDLESRIVEARKLLENLLSARQQARSCLEDAKSLLHPVRSIPNELLVEIFGYCISETPTDEDPDSLDPRAAPWLLTRVCRRWSNLAVNVPQLWTHLFLDFDKQKGHISDDQCAYKVGLFTERSRGLPMTVYLGSDDTLKDHPVLPVLEASIPRWRYLEVNLPGASLQRFSGNTFLMLQTLFLQYNDEDEWHPNLDVFKSASTPVLRHLEVHDDIPWRALEHVALPWSQVTSITSFPAFDPDGLDRLRTAADLEELSVVATAAHTPIHNPISLPKLRHLTITECNNTPGRSKEFFSALVVPVLSELTFEYYTNSVLHFPTSPVPLGNLTKLDITCNLKPHVENTQHLLNFLTLTHHIEYLRLYVVNMTVEFTDGLNLNKIADGLPPRLPCLQRLDFGKCLFAPCLIADLDLLFEMLYSRLPAVTVEGAQGVKETVAGMDGNGPSAATKETGTDFDPRVMCRCLRTVRFPRWLYNHTRMNCQEIFLGLTSRVDLECSVTMWDIDS